MVALTRTTFSKGNAITRAKPRTCLRKNLERAHFEALLRDGNYAEVCDIAKDILQGTNLVFRIEKARFLDGIKDATKHESFANALYDLLYDSAEMEEAHFTNSGDVLSEMGANEWTIATYYQFLASSGKWMFMKPSTMKRKADSLKIALNYKPEPNWLT
jgi:hypothetical protein